MNCPLCGRELVAKTKLDPSTGIVYEVLSCPIIVRMIRTYTNSSHIYDVSHYQKFDRPNPKLGTERSEIAYILPYRIHNLLDSNYCEVSDASDRKEYLETRVIFNCPLITFTSEDKLRQRIKNLVLFS